MSIQSRTAPSVSLIPMTLCARLIVISMKFATVRVSRMSPAPTHGLTMTVPPKPPLMPVAAASRRVWPLSSSPDWAVLRPSVPLRPGCLFCPIGVEAPGFGLAGLGVVEHELPQGRAEQGCGQVVDVVL